MNVPDDLRYSSEHEWAKRSGSGSGSGDQVRVGITDYAQDSLGDIVFIDLPTVGAEFASNAVLGEVESTKSVSEIYAPVGGTVTAVNDALSDRPELLNSDPYGEGWICEITLSDGAEFDALLDAAGYRSLTDS